VVVALGLFVCCVVIVLNQTGALLAGVVLERTVFDCVFGAVGLAATVVFVVDLVDSGIVAVDLVGIVSLNSLAVRVRAVLGLFALVVVKPGTELFVGKSGGKFLKALLDLGVSFGAELLA